MTIAVRISNEIKKAVCCADNEQRAWLAAENVELRGSDAAHEAKSLRQELTVAKAAHIRAVETAQQCYTELEVELKSHLRASQGEIDRLRADLESAKPLLDAAVRYRKSDRGFIDMATLGNTANDYAAKLDARKGGA